MEQTMPHCIWSLGADAKAAAMFHSGAWRKKAMNSKDNTVPCRSAFIVWWDYKASVRRKVKTVELQCGSEPSRERCLTLRGLSAQYDKRQADITPLRSELSCYECQWLPTPGRTSWTENDTRFVLPEPGHNSLALDSDFMTLWFKRVTPTS